MIDPSITPQSANRPRSGTGSKTAASASAQVARRMGIAVISNTWEVRFSVRNLGRRLVKFRLMDVTASSSIPPQRVDNRNAGSFAKGRETT